LKNLRESGLEHEKEPEQLAEPSQPAMSAPEEEPCVAETTLDAGEICYSTAAAAAAAAEAETVTAVSSVEITGAESGEEPLIEMAGEVESLAGGRLRLPLNIKYGGCEKKAAITVSVSFELQEM
jgi:hypothetical protein